MKTVNKNELMQDLNYLQKKLIEKHPNPFKYIKEGEFLSHIEEIIKDTNDMSIKEFGMKLMQLLASLNDGHTGLGLSFDVLGSLNCPFKFKYIYDGYYILSTSKKYKQYLGAKIIEINNLPMSKIEDLLHSLIPLDNEISLRYYLPSKIIEPVILNYFGIANSNKIIIKLKKDNKEIKLEVAAQDYNIDLLDTEDTLNQSDFTLKKKGKYWIKDLLKLDAVYLQYNECEERKDYKMGEVVKNFKNFHRKNLIIDLRNNRGGDSDVLNPLLNHIKRHQDKIKTFVLAGTDTYSSAIYNLVQLAKYRNVITVGDIPHGNPTHYGQARKFRLPNSKLSIFTSTRTFTFKGYRLGESFRPNYLVSQLPKELFKGKDTQFRYLSKNIL